MTTISNNRPDYSRYDTRVQNRLTADISSGKISAGDGAALGSALTDIQQQLSRSASQSSTSGASTSGSDPKTTIGSLIDGEVSSGKLTSDQAAELKSILGSHHGHRGGGPHKAGGSDQDGSDAANAAAGPQPADPSASDPATDPLAAFLKVLQDAQKTLATSSYGASGTASAATTSSGSLGLVDTTV